jgi:predicted P-loop ATPase
MDGVLVSSKGQILKDFHNVLKILEQHPDTAGLLAYNERDMMIYYTRAPVWSLGKRPLAHPIGDEDFSYITAWFNASVRCSVGVDSVIRGVIGVARRNRYDPFLDWLMSLQWDGVPRLDTWLVDFAFAEDSRYIRRVGRCFMISAAARAFKPGAKVDTMLILGGRQGARKSELLSALVGSTYFTDHLEDISNKDARMQIQGPVLIEIAELEAFNRAQTTAIKSFVSTRVDKFRAPYERSVSVRPRRCVFAGTTNKETYLKDETGGRRFWPVSVGYMVDDAGLSGIRDQLWAETVAAYKAGESWWLTEEEEALAREQQEAHREIDGWEEEFAMYLLLNKERAVMGKGLDPEIAEDRFDEQGRREWTTTNELLAHCVGISIGHHKSSDQRRAAKALRAIGWALRRIRTEGVQSRCYTRK